MNTQLDKFLKDENWWKWLLSDIWTKKIYRNPELNSIWKKQYFEQLKIGVKWKINEIVLLTLPEGYKNFTKVYDSNFNKIADNK